jgi:hypothetical protein
LAAALLAALVWILRLLARRLIRVLAGLSGLIVLSILLTMLVGIILFVITFPSWSGTYDNRAYGGSFRQIKKKAVQFKCGKLLTCFDLRSLCDFHPCFGHGNYGFAILRNRSLLQQCRTLINVALAFFDRFFWLHVH